MEVTGRTNIFAANATGNDKESVGYLLDQTENPNPEATEENKGKFWINVTEKCAFEGTYANKLLTTEQLSSIINSLFRGAYLDYEGCSIAIDPNNNNAIAIELAFRPGVQFELNSSLGATVMAIDELNVEAKDKRNVVERAQIMSNRLRSKNMFTLSKEAKDGLIDYMYIMNRNEKVDNFFAARYYERQMQQMYNRPQIVYAMVRGIDINKIISMVYGNADDNGEPVIYSIVPLRPIMTPNSMNYMYNNNAMGMNNMPKMNWLFNILRVPVEEVKELGRRTGEFVTDETNIYKN